MEATRIPGVRVIQFQHVHGKAKTPPHKPYDMRKVFYLVPARNAAKAGDGAEYNRIAFGYEIKEADAILDDGLVEKFKDFVYLEPCDLFVAPHPEDLTKNVVVDIQQSVAYVSTPMAAADKTDKPKADTKDKF